MTVLLLKVDEWILELAVRLLKVATEGGYAAYRCDLLVAKEGSCQLLEVAVLLLSFLCGY